MLRIDRIALCFVIGAMLPGFYGTNPQAAEVLLKPETTEKLVATAKKSIAVISYLNRDGQVEGMGSGFVVDPEGLVATNLHVIGEARVIRVTIGDNGPLEATEVFVSDRFLDLAILRIPARDLPALPLGDSSALTEGQPFVALGNPLGLRHSVVSGVVSALRNFEGRQLIQVAVPIEPGNSGGPMLNLDGQVVGILTMKSMVARNLGFAVPIDDLKKLMKQPNPIPLERWLTIGQLPAHEWKAVFGGNWRQRAGAIAVDRPGNGFGGRSLCLSLRQPLEPPFELGVEVKLDDESGAAGLVFHADGGDRHYGFYPSDGRLRLTRFDGPEVTSWQILKQKSFKHYRSGAWNYLKVRIEENKIRCYVNEQEVFVSDDRGLTAGQVGLAKFRDTSAVFRNFRMDRSLPSATFPEEQTRRTLERVKHLNPEQPSSDRTIQELAAQPEAAAILRQQAERLEAQSKALRTLAAEVHSRGIQLELQKVLNAEEVQIDLLYATLLIAKLDNEQLDIEPYRQAVDRMAGEIRRRITVDAGPVERLFALKNYLFAESGFHGSRTDYYNPSNSYMNEVLDDREGLPILLAVLTMELGSRLGLQMEGIGMPGHFLVQCRFDAESTQLMDSFDGGRLINREDAALILAETTGQRLLDEHLQVVSKKEIIARMLRNLMGVATRAEDHARSLRYLNTLLTIDAADGQARAIRAALYAEQGHVDAARRDLQWLLDHKPAGIDPYILERFRKQLIEE